MKEKFVNIDEEYNYYSNLYYKKFGRKAFLANPGGSKEQTIQAIKRSLEEDKDLLGELLNPETGQHIHY